MKKIVYILMMLLTINLIADSRFSTVVGSIKELLSCDQTEVYVRSFHAGLNKGGGKFYFDSKKPQRSHNGGTIIAKSKIFPATWDTINQIKWFENKGLSGKGCWIKVGNDSDINVRAWGAKNKVDCTPSLNALISIDTRGKKHLRSIFQKESIMLHLG